MARSPRARAPRLRQAIGALTVLLMLVVGVAFLTGHVGRALDDLGELAAALLAAVSCALAFRSASGRLRAGWAALAVACLSWAIGEAIWSTYELALHTSTPFPSLADVGFLGFPIGAMVALAVFPAGASRADRRRMTLDGLMVACAIGLVSWATALGAVVDAGADSVLATAVSVSYPLSDIALLVVCVLVLSRSRTHRLVLGFVAAGLALMAVSDSGFAYLTAQGSYSTGNPVDLGWFCAFGLLALAPLVPGATRSQVHSDSVAVAGAMLPYVPLAGALGFIGWRLATGHQLSGVETVLTAVLILLVLVRQFLTVRDNQQLALALAGREAELRHQAFHDTLTNLANRALYVDRVTHALALHRRDRRTLAICFLDLDGFKAVNDTHGHAAGDDLLKQVSARFSAVLSDADTLARLGGDEFAVLLENGPAPVEVARALLASLYAPFVVAGHEVSVLASVGVATVDPVDETPTVDELLTRADVAMYVVKRRGKADVLLHTAGLQLDELDDITLGRSLAAALKDKQISVAFQPIVDLSTGHVHTLEALARWAPGGRPVPPEVFVRVAERCNLVDELFRLVLEETCQQLARWLLLPGGGALRAAVNLSPQQLASPELVPNVMAALRRHGLDGSRLVLEITETEGLADATASRAVCSELRRLGIRLSVDDFGSGLSSLARLRDLPIDEVKIDRSFITGVDQDGGCRRFVRGVLAFAAEVGLVVVAEGVEREAERDALAGLGCQRAQGFLFSKAVSSEQVDALLRPRAPRTHGIPTQHGESSARIAW
jgi:diguanylate cyclase (GGDEF)-like protein